MIDSFYNKTSGRQVLILFVLTNAIYLTMLNVSIPTLIGFADGQLIFDMSPAGYSYQQAQGLLAALGDEGRQYYLTTQLPLDVLYPLLFTLCYSSLLLWLTKAGKLTSRIWRYFAYTPLLVSLFDYAENLCIWQMLTQYPNLSESLVQLSSAFTVVKSTLTMLYFVTVLAALIGIALNKVLGRNRTAKA